MKIAVEQELLVTRTREEEQTDFCVKEQEYCSERTGFAAQSERHLSRRAPTALLGSSPAGPCVWAGSRRCGGWRRADLKEIPVTSNLQRNGTKNPASTDSTTYIPIRFNSDDRRSFIGGSDARIIMGDDEADLIRLWREKRGEVEPEDFSANLIVQLGTVTEHLNRHWYERNTGQVVTEVQRQVFIL
jgi:hypothetical protein